MVSINEDQDDNRVPCWNLLNVGRRINSTYRSEELINSLLLIATGGVRHAERKFEPEIVAHGEAILHLVAD
jgi:hypothetical protein